MLRLKDKSKPDVNVTEMKDGDIAVITDWSVGEYVGQIVQRYGDDLVTVGDNWGHSWSSFFQRNHSKQCRVRILESGDELVIE